ncbi:methyltransferase, FkbM family [Pseudomonas asplenii]|uniref:Methyltransferase, FkbM family n=1 Tax=Pseudomonas asplenii TaxID=53407 RepID=A0A1H1RGC5_9PSED|nr:FkbM family methyltransferase [Pseudomonas asplenii]SDS34752.1 methyltransferase, FkbM family [Pseudomonas asplenii]
MSFLKKVVARLILLYKVHIKKDSFLLEAKRWFRDEGDKTLRLNYPLDENSVVFDLGGYQGDFAADIYEKYNCNIYIFEPVKAFYDKCVLRFSDIPKVKCFNYGLSSSDGWLDISLAENASSFSSPLAKGNTERVEVRSIAPCIKALDVDKINLIKINIEGGEYDVLPALIASGDISKIENIQVQFHNFVAGAESKRETLREALEETHDETWCYEFVWENWKKKNKSVV